MKYKSTINLEVSLVEIILSVLIFAITGVIMLNCFAIAKFTQQKSNDKTNASVVVQSSFEYMKSANNYKEMKEIIEKTYSNETVTEINNETIYTIYYDNDLNECSKENYEFEMKINIKNISNTHGEMSDMNVSMEKVEKYPFIKNEDKIIYFIESKKFFPIYKGGNYNE
jgi:type II secretory pathway pseudopilin PulG